MQDREYLYLVAFYFINGNVIWVKHVLPGSKNLPRRPNLLRLQNIYLFAKLLGESFCPSRTVFGNVGGNRIEATNGAVRPA